MARNKNGRPMRAGKGGNRRHGERVSYRALVHRFVYAVADATVAAVDIIAYGVFAIAMVAYAAWRKKKGEKKE